MNNPDLYNAAIAGASGGSQNRWIVDTFSDQYDTIKAALVAFATAVDTAIPTTTVTQADVLILQSIVAGVTANRFPQSTTEADYAPIANAIAALFSDMRVGQEASTFPVPIVVEGIVLSVPETASGTVRVTKTNVVEFRRPLFGVMAVWPQLTTAPNTLSILDAWQTNTNGNVVVRFLAENWLADDVTVNLIGFGT